MSTILKPVPLNQRDSQPTSVTDNGTKTSTKVSSLIKERANKNLKAKEEANRKAREVLLKAIKNKENAIKAANEAARKEAQSKLTEKKKGLPKERPLPPSAIPAAGSPVSQSVPPNKSTNRYLFRNQKQISEALARSRKNTGTTLPEKIASTFLPYQTGYNFTNNTQLTPEEIVEILSEKYAAEAGPAIRFNPANSDPGLNLNTQIAKTQLHNRLSNRGTQARVHNVIDKLRTIKELDNRDIRRVYNVLAKLSNNAHYPGRKILKAKMDELARNRVAAGNNTEIVNSRIASEIDEILLKANNPQTRLNYTTKSIIYTSLQLKEIRELFNQFRSFVTSKGYLEDPVVQERLKYILAQYALVRDRIEQLIETYEVEDFISIGANTLENKKNPFRPNYYLHFIYPLVTAVVAKQAGETIDEKINAIFISPGRAGGPNTERDPAMEVIKKMIKGLIENSKAALSEEANIQKLRTYFPAPQAQGPINNVVTNEKNKFNGIFNPDIFWNKYININCTFNSNPPSPSPPLASGSGSASSLLPNKSPRGFNQFYQCIHKQYESYRAQPKPEYILVTIPEWNLKNDDYDTTRLLNRFRSYTFTLGYNRYTPKSFYFVNVPERSMRGGGAVSYHQNLRKKIEIPAGNQAKNPITVVTERSGKYYIYGAGRKEVLTPFDMRNMLQFGLPLYILYQVDFSLREGGLAEQEEYHEDSVYRSEAELEQLFSIPIDNIDNRWKDIKERYERVGTITPQHKELLQTIRLILCKTHKTQQSAQQTTPAGHIPIYNFIKDNHVNKLLQILGYCHILLPPIPRGPTASLPSSMIENVDISPFIKEIIRLLLTAFIDITKTQVPQGVTITDFPTANRDKLKSIELFDRNNGSLIESNDVACVGNSLTLKTSIQGLLTYISGRFGKEYHEVALMNIDGTNDTYGTKIQEIYTFSPSP